MNGSAQLIVGIVVCISLCAQGISILINKENDRMSQSLLRRYTKESVLKCIPLVACGDFIAGIASLVIDLQLANVINLPKVLILVIFGIVAVVLIGYLVIMYGFMLKKK